MKAPVLNASSLCYRSYLLVAIAVLVLLAPASVFGADATATRGAPSCAERFNADGVTFRSDFPGARVNEYARLDNGEFELTIRPENTPINNSAWYAFQVVSDQAKTITVRLTYENGTHRYHPQVSTDGRNWSRLDDSAVQRSTDKRQAVIRLDVGTDPLWVAGQELIGRERLEGWMEKLAELPFVKQSVIGRSIENRPIYSLQITESDDPGHVVVIGRQHPPEVTGTLGLMAFVDRLVETDAKAAEFRKAFQVTVVCLVNPDGVDRGYWRSNVNGVDLNRDWGKFAQPETRAVRDHVLPLHQPPDRRIYLWLDFHSTHQDVFYTQPDETETFPPLFTRQWLEALDRRTPGYSVRRVNSAGGKQTSMQWAHRTFGAPAITYEFGDNTDRAEIRQVARTAAEEMMRLLVPARQRKEAAAPQGNN
jgi:cytosolic carboxypeptidase protein 6